MPFYTRELDTPARANRLQQAMRQFFNRLLAARDRSGDVRRLQQLSDEDLSKIGLSRNPIMRRVYSDVYNI